MVIHSFYTDDSGHKVYLDSVDAVNAFYKIGHEMIVSTLAFFESKYSLIK